MNQWSKSLRQKSTRRISLRPIQLLPISIRPISHRLATLVHRLGGMVAGLPNSPFQTHSQGLCNMSMSLTPQQIRIFRFVRDYRNSKGYSPTMQEIANELGVSKVTVFEHVEALIEKGALIRTPNKARSLEIATDAELPDERANEHELPLIGRIAAGHPVEKYEQSETLRLDTIFGTRLGPETGRELAIRGRGARKVNHVFVKRVNLVLGQLALPKFEKEAAVVGIHVRIAIQYDVNDSRGHKLVLVFLHTGICDIFLDVVHVNAALFFMLYNHWFNAYCMPILKMEKII